MPTHRTVARSSVHVVSLRPILTTFGTLAFLVVCAALLLANPSTAKADPTPPIQFPGQCPIATPFCHTTPPSQGPTYDPSASLPAGTPTAASPTGSAAPTNVPTTPAYSPLPTATSAAPEPVTSTGATAPPTQAGDATNRGKNFITGNLDTSYDINPVQTWYIESTDAIKFAVFTAHVPHASDVFYGQLSNLCFTGYKYVIWGVVTGVGYIVFGLLFITWLFKPALHVAQLFQDAIITPSGAAPLLCVIAAAYAGLLWLRNHYSRAIIEYAMTAMILGLASLFIPAPAAMWLISLVTGAAAVVLVAGSGGDPSSVPAATTGSIDNTVIMAAYHHWTGGLLQLLVGRVCEILTFGGVLPSQCEGPYQQGIALNLSANDPDNFQFMQKVPECNQYIAAAGHPDAVRTMIAAGLIFYAIVFAIVFSAMAWPALKGQIQFMLALALHPILFMAAAIPGSPRVAVLRYLLNVVVGLFGLVLFALNLALMLTSMTAILGASVGLPIGWTLLAALSVPIVELAMLWKLRKTQRRTTNAIAYGMTGRAPVSNTKSETTRGERLLKATGTIAVDAAGAATGAALAYATSGASKAAGMARKAASTGASKTRGATKAAVTGGETKPGLILGPRTVADDTTTEEATVVDAPPVTPAETERPATPTAPRAATAPSAPRSPAEPPRRRATRGERARSSIVARSTNAVYQASARAAADAILADQAETAQRRAAEDAARAAHRPARHVPPPPVADGDIARGLLARTAARTEPTGDDAPSRGSITSTEM